MKKTILFLALFSAVILSVQCHAYEPSLSEKPSEITKVPIVTSIAVTEEKEIALWEELTIYSLIVGIYGAYWIWQKP